MTDADRLDTVLDQMYRCILAADFGNLPKIVTETEQLVRQLGAISDRQSAQTLHRKATRVGLCLQAASRGLSAAQRRLGEMGDGGAALSTYTSSGQRAASAFAPVRITHRF